MRSLVILGANSFVGKTLIGSNNITLPVKAVVRKILLNFVTIPQNVTWFEADLLNPSSLDNILEEGDVVINLAYIKMGGADNVVMIDNIIMSCLRNKVRKLIHCSTAVVVGRNKCLRINELTPCFPFTQYEQNKYVIEQKLLEVIVPGLEVIIVRPTAIIGLGGENLLKLIEALTRGNAIVNYFRACFFGKRKMHLVPVANVVAALIHLALLQSVQNGNVFIISADDQPENNFFAVEKMLFDALGLPPRKIPVLLLPLFVLSCLLKLGGRSELNLQRVYNSKKLLSTDFTPTVSLQNAVYELATLYKKGFEDGQEQFSI